MTKIAFVLALLALVLLPAQSTPAHALTCPGVTPLYSVAAGDESAKQDWYFAGVAGQVGNGYAGTMYVSIFDPDPTNNVVSVKIDEYSEAADLQHVLFVFTEGVALQANRSTTLGFDGRQYGTPTGKVHFHISATAPVNVYAEQWWRC